jgi:hypothetical protein
MLILNGFFKDNTFIPDRDLSVPDGTKAVVSVEDSSQIPMEETARLKQAWHDFFKEIRAIDEELPPEFDEILARGIRLNEAGS